jgi:beta-lactamase class A
MTTRINALPNLLRSLELRQVKVIALNAVRALVFGICFAVVVSVAIQLMYPSSLALPQTRVGGKNYGFRHQLQIAGDIMRLNGQNLLVYSGEQTLRVKPGDIGLTLDGTKEAQNATKYSLLERLTPFSLFLEKREILGFNYKVDEAKALAFAESLKQYDRAPVNALVKLDGTNVVVEKGQTGYSYDSGVIFNNIKNIGIDSRMKVNLAPMVTEPDIPENVVAESALILQQRLQNPLTIEANGKSITADPATLATWMVLTPDPANKKLHISFDRHKVKEALSSLANQVYRPSTPSGVTMHDGVETSRSDGAAGEGLDIDASADAVIASATRNQPQVQGVMQAIAPVYRVQRNYSRTSHGLQALLNYWDESEAGTWGIVLKDFNGSVNAAINPDRQFTSASVYKIYVAYVVYAKSDAGQISMGSPTSNGNTVAGCLEIMITRSDNACGNALGEMIGWSASNGMLHSQGFTSTSIAYGGQATTANDAAKYLTALQNGYLMSSGNRADMLSKMGRGIYRYAIPAGSSGMHVANKLGALGAFNHDVAIVYHPRGTYVLSVFSNGSSHARIRELARQISQVMNQ